MTDHTAELERVLADQERVRFERFDLDDAWRLGSLIRELAAERDLRVAIDIRIGEQQAFHSALPGTAADNDDWIARKIASVRRFGVSSYALRLRQMISGADFPVHLDPARYAFAGGCVPVVVGGALAGTVTVSGLPQEDDHALVVEAMERHLGRG